MTMNISNPTNITRNINTTRTRRNNCRHLGLGVFGCDVRVWTDPLINCRQAIWTVMLGMCVYRSNKMSCYWNALFQFKLKQQVLASVSLYGLEIVSFKMCFFCLFLTSVCLHTKSLKVWGDVVRTQPTDFLAVLLLLWKQETYLWLPVGFPTGRSPHLHLTSWFTSSFA